MGLVDQVKTAATSFITPNTTIDHLHNDEEGIVGSTFDVSDGTNTPEKAAINPWDVKLPSIDSFNNRVQSSGWYNRTSDLVFKASHDTYNFTNTALKFSKPGGVENFTARMNTFIQDNMVAARLDYNQQKINQANFEEKYPNLTFMPSQHGLLYTDPISGKTGHVSELS